MPKGLVESSMNRRHKLLSRWPGHILATAACLHKGKFPLVSFWQNA